MRYLNARNTAFGEDRKIYSTVDSTATAGQTVFNVAYDQGRVAVFLNGIRLVPVQDYTYTLSGIGSNITLGAGITANDYLELIGLQGINAGNAVTEDNFVVGTASTGSGGSYTNSTTVFPVSSSSGDLVSVWRNGIKLVPTTDFTVASNASTVTLQAAANTADEITVHVVGILQHSNFVQSTGGTFTGTVAHTGDTTFGDNNKSIYGAGSDLQIYHDGSHSLIAEAGTGALKLKGDDIRLEDASGNNIIKAVGSGSAELYESGSKKLETTSTGVTVTGEATVTGDLTVDTNTLKVDSANNAVLVGQTSGYVGDSASASGFRVQADGFLDVAKSGSYVMRVNRQSSDGDIISFRKDGSTVGSIGVRDGTSLYIESTASTRTGLDLSGDILPRYGGSLSDNQTDLGASSYRFKDLYLSGGVFLGGTGSANKISDYEEGTWNAQMDTTATGFTTSGRGGGGHYTKVGNMVTAWADISINSPTNGTGNFIVSGLPFPSKSGFYTTTHQIRWGRVNFPTTFGSICGYLSAGNSYIEFLINYDSAVNGQMAASDLNGLATPYMALAISYLVN